MQIRIPWLNEGDPFPNPETALKEPPGYAGLVAASDSFSPKQLIAAYRQGIFPWSSDPVTWFSTDPRMVLKTDSFIVSHSLKKKLKLVHKSIHSAGPWQLSFDTDFDAVIRECAKPRKKGGGTWISDDFIKNYGELHRMGIAHSSELRHEGRLVGGAYGLCLGRMFYGESMFALIPDASKIALAHLVFFLRSQGVKMIDCQQETAHLASLGASPISRKDFSAHIKTAAALPAIPSWETAENCPFCAFFGSPGQNISFSEKPSKNPQI